MKKYIQTLDLATVMRVTFIQLLLATTFSLVTYAREGMGQSVLDRKIQFSASHMPLRDVLSQLEKRAEVRFIYSSRSVQSDLRVSLSANNDPLSQVLSRLLGPLGIGYGVYENQVVLSRTRMTQPLASIETALPKITAITPVDVRIRGKVTDATTGTPIPGVSILVKGTNRGVTTDVNGDFQLEVPGSESVLIVSSVGYIKQEVAVGGQTNLAIQLKSDIKALDEVVVVGYGTVKRSDLTGSVAQIKGDKLLDRQSQNVAQALQGRMPGVDVQVNSAAPGYQPRVRIRGVNSINSSVEPLYVVDGIIGVSNANLLNPNDIESVEVLKDASATAIYGARGANGVILITTKHGQKGATQVTYDAYAMYLEPARHVRALDANEFMYVYNKGFENTAKYDPAGYAAGKYVANDVKNFPKLFDANGKPLYNTNWEKLIYRPTWGMNHEIGIRGGGEKSNFSLSLGYLDQGGLMRNSYFKRYSAKLSLDSEVKSWLKVGGSIFLNKSQQRVTDDGSGGLNVPRMVVEALPILPIKYPDGTWGRNKDWPGMEGGENPVRITEERQQINNPTQAIGQFYSLFKFNDDLTLRSSFGYDLLFQKNNFYSGRDLNALSADQKGSASISSNFEYYWQFENYLNWKKQLGAHHTIDAMAGLSWQKRQWENYTASAQNFIDDFWGWHNLGVGTSLQTPSSSDQSWQLNSYFARVNYSYKGKYLFTATGRYDGSSKFGKNNKYAFFPSAAVAWNVAEEDFMKSQNLFSRLKIRASVGKTGNQEIGQYASQQFLSTGTVLLNGARQTGIWRGSFGNPDLKWESTNQADIGLEASFLNGRIDFMADYYHKVTKNLLLNAPIPWSTGLSSVTQNIGSVQNNGVELTLVTRNITTRDFNWTTNLNWASNKNKILQLGVNNDDIYPGPNFLGNTNILRVGEAIGTLWGRKRLGTFSSSEVDLAKTFNKKPGDLKWADLNNDGKIDSQDETIIGRSYPKWTLNFGNTFQYKNWDLSVDIRFVVGVNTVNATKHSVQDRTGIANSLASVLDAWRPDHQNTKIAEIRNYNAGYDTRMDDWWVEDGAHVRGQNVVLGYSLPQNLLTKWKVSRLRLYASAQNFFLITNYSGYDPEALTGFGNQLTTNMEFFQYPKPRTFNFGLNLGF